MSKPSLLSPLKITLMEPEGIGQHERELIAAALYDDTASQQLTTGLFVGVGNDSQRLLKGTALEVLNHALNPPGEECRWTDEQQDKLRGFIKLVEALKP